MPERLEGQSNQFSSDLEKKERQSILGSTPELYETATQYLATLPEHERQLIQENIELAWEAFEEMWQFEFDELMQSCRESTEDQAKDIINSFNLPDQIKSNIVAAFTNAASEKMYGVKGAEKITDTISTSIEKYYPELKPVLAETFEKSKITNWEGKAKPTNKEEAKEYDADALLVLNNVGQILEAVQNIREKQKPNLEENLLAERLQEIANKIIQQIMAYGQWDRSDWREYEIISGNEQPIEGSLFSTFDDRAPSQKDIEEKLLQLAEEYPSLVDSNHIAQALYSFRLLGKIILVDKVKKQFLGAVISRMGLANPEIRGRYEALLRDSSVEPRIAENLSHSIGNEKFDISLFFHNAQLSEEFPNKEIRRLTTKAMKQQGSDQAYQEINLWLKDLVANIVATSAAEEERYMERLNQRLDHHYVPKHGYLRSVLNRDMPTKHQRKKVAEGSFKPE